MKPTQVRTWYQLDTLVSASTLVLMLASIVIADPPLLTDRPHDADASQKNHSTDDIAKQLRVRQGFEVRLVAAEPDVVDPVSAAWSYDGRLWVVEMSDYPQPRPNQIQRNGRIRVLSNRDANGGFRSVKTFAHGLDFATGVLPWRDGAIVTLAGQIVFLRDLDGDGQADAREVWFEGFTVDNEQLRANHPTLGPDGWVYVAGGLRGGEINAVDPRFKSKTAPVKLSGRDFVFNPNGGDWGTVSGDSQHGLTIDDFNRRIGCSNRNPAIEAVISTEVIDHDPFLTPRDALSDVGRAGFESEVHPISEAWTTSNLHAGQFSAACGVFAPGWTNDEHGSEWLLVCEPTGSLVQRQRLRIKEGIWKSERESIDSEWLACGDDWFRAVDLLPDVGGGILVIDMARAVIEHPHWAPPELKDRPDTFAGNDLGRIWMVHQATGAIEPLAIVDDAAALEAIVARDPLPRALASAYWYQHYSTDAVPDEATSGSLTRIVTSHTTPTASKSRVALLLNRWGLMTQELHESLSSSDNDRIRALAIGLRADNDPDRLPLLSRDKLMSAFSDDSPTVRRVALETFVASTDSSDVDDVTVGRLARLAGRDGNDRWMQKLLTAVPAESAFELLSASLDDNVVGSTEQPSTEVLEGWMRRAAAKDRERAAGILIRWTRKILAKTEDGSTISGVDREMQSLVMRVAAAWQTGSRNIARGRRHDSIPSDETEDTFWVIDALAIAIAVDDQHAVAARLDAIAWMGELVSLPTELRGLVDSRVAAAVRAAAFGWLFRRDVEWAKHYLLEHVDSLAPSDRVAIVDAIRRDSETGMWLLTQISNQGIARTFVDPASMDWFRGHSDSRLAQLGRETFAPPGDVMAVLREYSSSTMQLDTADLASGKALFAQHCANCHRIADVGHAMGPDISDSREKTPEALLSAILDPSAAIDASYASYQLLTVGGEAISGLLADESGDAVTLRIAGGQIRRIERDDIEHLRASSSSLMPEGFQRSIDVSQMRDLIAYLKRWRYGS